MIVFVSILMGMIIGSFLNVCVYRMPRNKSIVWPGSACPKCGTPIKFYDNIPVLSFIILGAKCRSCGERISWRYPVIELFTGLLTGLYVHRMLAIDAWWWMLPCLAAVYALIVLSLIDIEFFIIPDELSIGLIVLGLVSAFINPNFTGSWLERTWQSLLGGIAGFGIVWLLAVAGEFLFKKEAMGGGDIKLMGGVGALTGWQGVFATLFIGSLLGTIYGVYLMIAKKATRQDPIPFGPFLAFGAMLNLYQVIPFSVFLWNY